MSVFRWLAEHCGDQCTTATMFSPVALFWSTPAVSTSGGQLAGRRSLRQACDGLASGKARSAPRSPETCPSQLPVITPGWQLPSRPVRAREQAPPWRSAAMMSAATPPSPSESPRRQAFSDGQLRQRVPHQSESADHPRRRGLGGRRPVCDSHDAHGLTQRLGTLRRRDITADAFDVIDRGVSERRGPEVVRRYS